MCEVHGHSSVELLGYSTGLTPDELGFALMVTMAVLFSATLFLISVERIRGGDD